MKVRVSLAAALVVVAVALLVPAASWSHGHRTASVLTGKITRVPGGIAVAVTNSGTDSFNYVEIQMVSSVHHTGATIAPTGGCGPGPDSNTVKCGVSYAGIQPGQTYTVTITTDVPYPQNGGAKLLAGVGTSGTNFVLAGQATGPPDAVVVKCTCSSLTASIAPKSVTVHDRYPKPAFFPLNYMELKFSLHWAMRCTAGTTGCEGTVTVVAPKGKTYHTRIWDGKQKVDDLDIECSGDCGEPLHGADQVEIVAAHFEAHDRKGKTIPIVIERECTKDLPPLRLSIAFNANGNVDPKRSKLH